MIDKLAVVATRLKDMKLVHPDQDNDHVCSQCGTPVGVYPSSMRALKDNPQAVLMCARCAFGKMRCDDWFQTAGTVDEIMRENHESMRRQ